VASNDFHAAKVATARLLVTYLSGNVGTVRLIVGLSLGALTPSPMLADETRIPEDVVGRNCEPTFVVRGQDTDRDPNALRVVLPGPNQCC